MCGFAGFLSVAGQERHSEITLRAMADAIKHRGPDDSGIWFDESAGIGFCHARLSILDLSAAGHQPMLSACSRYVLAFNGEIYNHLILRDRLSSEGHSPSWRGHSDTETLLACFSVWGIEATLSATVGMFALALWDRELNALTFARDRLGEKPLYLGISKGTLLFGSELKSLSSHYAFDYEIDRNSLALLLRHNYIPAPYSIYKSIQKLMPGHYVTVVDLNAGLPESKAYWSLKDVVQSGQSNLFEGTFEQAVSGLENVLSSALDGQMLADVPLGAFLSGGVDSSVIVALMQQQREQPIKTFSIGFNEEGYNEAQYAKEVAHYLGTQHTEMYVDAIEALAVIPHLGKIYCEPFADSSQIPTYLVSKLAKQHVTVALSGDGGDELFGGYNTYQFAPKIWSLINKFPLALRRGAAELFSVFPAPDKLSKLLKVLPAEDRTDFYRRLISHWQNPTGLVIGSSEVPTIYTSKAEFSASLCFEHWMMASESLQYMPDDVLVKVDRAAMANSLETRVPLLDHRVVEFAWTLPLPMKINNGVGKAVLKELLFKYVPRRLIERPKKGFSVPLAQWLRGPLRDWAEELLNKNKILAQGYFYPEIIAKLWLEHQTGKQDHSSKLWGVLMFQAWLEERK